MGSQACQNLSKQPVVGPGSDSIHRTEVESTWTTTRVQLQPLTMQPAELTLSVTTWAPQPVPGHPASPWIPSNPTENIPSSSGPLAGHHPDSNWGKGNSFPSTCTSSHWSQMFAMLSCQQQPLADSPLIVCSSCQCASMPCKLPSLSWSRTQVRTSPKLGTWS